LSQSTNTNCAECGMPCESREFHPLAACALFKMLNDAAAVRSNLEFVLECGRKQSHEIEQGFAVQIARDDGSTFLCAANGGVLTQVWPRAQRKYAVSHKRDLIANGFKAKVVAVEFVRPRVVQEQIK